jgi:hypothetical protein
MVSIMDGGMRRIMGNDPVVLFGVMFLECCVGSVAFVRRNKAKVFWLWVGRQGWDT